MKDRQIFLNLIDCAIDAYMTRDDKAEEAIVLAEMYEKATAAELKMEANIINYKHSQALHKGSECKDRIHAYLAIARHLARQGYEVV